MPILLKGTGKNQLESGQVCMEDSPVLSHCFFLRNTRPNWPVCWSIVAKQKPKVGFPFFETFPFDPTPKATKVVNVYLFIHSFTARDELIKDNVLTVKNSSKIRKRIPGAFWSYYVFRSFSEIVVSLFAELHLSERLTFTERSEANKEEFLINPVGVRKLIATRMKSSWVYFWRIGKKHGFLTPLSALTCWQI